MSLGHQLTPTLRLMTEADFEAALTLWRRCQGVRTRDWEDPSALAALLTRNPGGCWVVAQGGLLIGTILCGHDGWRGYIYHAAVDPEWQRAGLGTALVEQAMGYFRAQRVARVHALVSTDNASGRAFWLAVGAELREDVDLFTIEPGTLHRSPIQ